MEPASLMSLVLAGRFFITSATWGCAGEGIILSTPVLKVDREAQEVMPMKVKTEFTFTW